MTIQVFGSQATVSFLNRAFSDTSPSNAIFKNQVAAVDAKGELAFANAFAVSWAGVSNAALSKQVLTNMGILPSTDSSVTALEGALADYFASAGTKTKDPSTGLVTSDTRGTVVLQLAKILSGLEGTTTGAQAVYNTAATAWNNEVVASYTYSSNASNTVTSTPTTGTTPVVTNFALTTGTDTITGTSGDDLIDGTTANTLSAFDSIDGGTGTDTLNVGLGGTGSTITGLPSGVSIKNVENVSIGVVSTNGFTVDASQLSGVTNLTVGNTKAVTVNGGGTAAINAASTGDTVTVNGGSAVTASATGASAVSVTGAALTTVSVKGGTPTISNSTSSMTAVTLDGIGGSNASITGGGVSTLTWKNQTTSVNAVFNNSASLSATVNVDGVGYSTAGSTAGINDLVVVGTAATSATINATGAKSALALTQFSGSALATLNVTGSADLVFAVTGAAGLTKIDGSTATGAITVGNTATPIPANVTTLNTGSGNDKVTLVAANAAANINLGAGNDIVFGTAIAGGVTGIVDGGAGIDSVSIELFNGQFKNFELLEIGGLSAATSAAATSSITGLTLSSSSVVANTATVTDLPAAATLTVTNQVTTANAGVSTLSLKSNTAADAFTITFAGTTTDTTPSTFKGDAGIVNVNDIENLNIVSGGTTGNKLTVGDTSLQTLTITGAKDLTVLLTAGDTTTNAQAVGSAPMSSTDTVNGVKLIDASAATGKVTIDASPLTFTATAATAATATAPAYAIGDMVSSVAKAGLTIKGGTGADTIIGTAKADTIIGGGGADTITGGLGADKITLSGNTSTIVLGGQNDTGVSTATVSTQPAVLTASYDIITGATAGTTVKLGLSGTTLPTVANTPADTLMGTNNTVVFARGTYNASTGSFSFGAAGADTAMTYDFDVTGTTDFHTIILVGYVPSTGTVLSSASTGSTAIVTL